MPQRTPFEQIALLLQGGGALGAYQAGVYEALAEADLHPDWVAGISIGAINSAIIAGNPPERRVDALREFWHAVSTSPLGIPSFRQIRYDDTQHEFINLSRAWNILLFGAPHFFVPRVPPPHIWPPSTADKASYYDNTPLRATLERLVDFDRINYGEMRFSVGAVEIRSGNFVYFDSKTHKIAFEHIAASGSLPPGFPATRIGDEYFWDGGLISNTPLEWVLDSRPRRDTLAFQVDLWNARGELPKDMIGVEVRHKEIIYSSRNRAATERYRYVQKLRIALANLLAKVPEELHDDDDAKLLLSEANDKVCNIVHLIYRAKPYEGIAKDFEFSRRTMEEHWQTGYRNARETLANPQVLELPDRLQGVRTFDGGARQQ
ncbi:MAG TPA: patatin-like phospholipase family protein [Xanthobacteraceae bacterium]|nr:patatin-like phospholipase family protein [Xanthobacteraceae bacterium]